MDLANREIVFDLGNNLPWDWNQPVLTELGLFDIEGAIIAAIVVSL